MSLRIGIDIGSTTVKVVVLDEQNKLLFRSYERHYSKTRERACETLKSISGQLSGQRVKLVITGSAGLGVAKAAGLDFVQEVYATAAAVNTYIPDTDAVIELGGEDAKIIFFGGALEERMNGSCAGGTGAFIDQMATLMNVSVNELDSLSLKHEKIYPIASRCGVFAKSDIQPILNQGGRKEDVAASIFQAVVDQTVAGLTQGRELKGKIVFLGGPLHFLMGLRQRFVETLKLDGEHAVFPEDGDCFAAMGAALCATDYEPVPFEDALKRLEESRETNTSADTMPPLFDTQEEYDAFLVRHNASRPPEADIHTYAGPAWLGMDAGSTTTKLALITADGGLLYTYYHSNPVSYTHLIHGTPPRSKKFSFLISPFFHGLYGGICIIFLTRHTMHQNRSHGRRHIHVLSQKADRPGICLRRSGGRGPPLFVCQISLYPLRPSVSRP